MYLDAEFAVVSLVSHRSHSFLWVFPSPGWGPCLKCVSRGDCLPSAGPERRCGVGCSQYVEWIDLEDIIAVTVLCSLCETSKLSTRCCANQTFC